MQDAAIYQYYAIPPGGRNVEDLIMANSAVMVSLITTALYVRELASRWVHQACRPGSVSSGSLTCRYSPACRLACANST